MEPGTEVFGEEWHYREMRSRAERAGRLTRSPPRHPNYHWVAGRSSSSAAGKAAPKTPSKASQLGTTLLEPPHPRVEHGGSTGSAREPRPAVVAKAQGTPMAGIVDDLPPKSPPPQLSPDETGTVLTRPPKAPPPGVTPEPAASGAPPRHPYTGPKRPPGMPQMMPQQSTTYQDWVAAQSMLPPPPTRIIEQAYLWSNFRPTTAPSNKAAAERKASRPRTPKLAPTAPFVAPVPLSVAGLELGLLLPMVQPTRVPPVASPAEAAQDPLIMEVEPDTAATEPMAPAAGQGTPAPAPSVPSSYAPLAGATPVAHTPPRREPEERTASSEPPAKQSRTSAIPPQSSQSNAGQGSTSDWRRGWAGWEDWSQWQGWDSRGDWGWSDRR